MSRLTEPVEHLVEVSKTALDFIAETDHVDACSLCNDLFMAIGRVEAVLEKESHRAATP